MWRCVQIYRWWLIKGTKFIYKKTHNLLFQLVSMSSHLFQFLPLTGCLTRGFRNFNFSRYTSHLKWDEPLGDKVDRVFLKHNKRSRSKVTPRSQLQEEKKNLKKKTLRTDFKIDKGQGDRRIVASTVLRLCELRRRSAVPRQGVCGLLLVFLQDSMWREERGGGGVGG